MSSVVRTSKGRQKIDIKKIEKRSSRQVTFSKRRVGLFKCAEKFSVLSGSQIAILVRSPGNKVFAYGTPNLDTIIDRWLIGNNTTYTSDHRDFVPPSPTSSSTIASDEGTDRFWWEEPVPENMGLAELEEYVDALERLKNNVSEKAQRLSMVEEFGSELTDEFDEALSMVDGWLNLAQDQGFSDELGFESFGVLG